MMQRFLTAVTAAATVLGLQGNVANLDIAASILLGVICFSLIVFEWEELET